jgi:Protein of unknown function (Hypoth_ymh)
MEVAIFESFKAVVNRVKTMTGVEGDGGAGMLGQVLSDENPRLVLGDLFTQTGKDVQRGMRFLFMGAATAIRNPDAHERSRPFSRRTGSRSWRLPACSCAGSTRPRSFVPDGKGGTPVPASSCLQRSALERSSPFNPAPHPGRATPGGLGCPTPSVVSVVSQK